MWLLEQQCTFWVLGLWCCCIHRAVLNRRRKERAKKTQERFCGVLFLSLFPSLSLTGKASDISRQKTNSVSPVKSSVKAAQEFFFPLSLSFLLSLCLFLSLSLSVFASFPWMRCCEGRLHAFQTITVHPPTASFLSARTLHMPAHPLESLEPTTNAKHFHRREKRGAHPQAPV